MSVPTSILDTLIDDLLFLFSEDQTYTKHPEDGRAVIVETYTDDGKVEGRYTVTFSIEKLNP